VLSHSLIPAWSRHRERLSARGTPQRLSARGTLRYCCFTKETSMAIFTLSPTSMLPLPSAWLKRML